MHASQHPEKISWLARGITLLIFGILVISCQQLLEERSFPLQIMQLPDLFHNLLPFLPALLGLKAASWLWWSISISINIVVAVSLAYLLFTGRGQRMVLAFGFVAFFHGLFWHFTVLPRPEQMMWQFPFITGEVPMQNDFWFSGHAAYPFLLALYSQGRALWIRVLTWLYCAAMWFMILSIHVHYSIDVVGAIFVSYSLYKWLENLETRKA